MADLKSEPHLKITIDIFSGRKNPVIPFTGKKMEEALERLRIVGRTSDHLPSVPTLGYRGMLVEQVGQRQPDLPESFRLSGGVLPGREFGLRISDDSFEEFVCGSVAKNFPRDRLIDAINEYKSLARFWREQRWEGALSRSFEDTCKCAPLYEPEWWNVPARQPHNNCYNYSCNYRTDTFAQPGKASGQMYQSLACSEVRPAAIRDDLIDAPGADNKCPEEGHLVALVVAPGWDYHWYRKGRDGMWSHKPGGTAVTDRDNSGNVISDPRTADRGPYTDFCTYMIVKHGHIKIK